MITCRWNSRATAVLWVHLNVTNSRVLDLGLALNAFRRFSSSTAKECPERRRPSTEISPASNAYTSQQLAKWWKTSRWSQRGYWRQQASRDGLEGQWSGLLKNHRHCTCDLLGFIWCVQESFENVLWRRRTRYRLCLASSCLTDNTLRSCKDSISLILRYKHCLNSISDSYKRLNTWWKRQGSTHQIYWWRGGGC